MGQKLKQYGKESSIKAILFKAKRFFKRVHYGSIDPDVIYHSGNDPGV